ncbi:MAG: perosamine synthetase [Psychroserpens sp.]
MENGAEALGSSFKGQAARSFGALAAFSFNGNKIITAGGGGAIVSSNIELVAKAKYLTTTAKISHPWD